MAEIQVIKVRLVVPVQQVTLEPLGPLETQATPEIPVTTVLLVMVVPPVTVILVQLVILVPLVMAVAAVVVVLAVRETMVLTVFSAPRTVLSSGRVTEILPQTVIPAMPVLVLLARLMAVLEVMPKTPGLIEHPMRELLVMLVVVGQMATRVLRVTLILVRRAILARLEQMVTLEVVATVLILAVPVIREPLEIKELLVTLEMQEMQATLVLTQTSVIL